MSTKLGEVFVDVGARLDGLKKGLDQARRDSQAASTQIEKSLMGIQKAATMVGKAIGTAFLIGGIKKIIDTAAAFEKQQIAFETMLKSGEKAKKLINDIKDFSASTPFQMPGLIETAKQLLAFGISSEDVVQKMHNLGNIAQGDQAKFERIAYAYGKISAKGKASMEELNMVIEAGVPILQELAEQQGVTKDQLFKMVETGKVGFKQVDDALTKMSTGSGQFAGMLEKQSQSLSGVLSTLIDNITLIGLEIGNELSPGIKSLAEALLSTVDGGNIFVDVLKFIGRGIAQLTTGLAVLVNGINYFRQSLIETGGDVSGYVLALERMGIAMNKNGTLTKEGLAALRNMSKEQQKAARIELDAISDILEGNSKAANAKVKYSENVHNSLQRLEKLQSTVSEKDVERAKQNLKNDQSVVQSAKKKTDYLIQYAEDYAKNLYKLKKARDDLIQGTMNVLSTLGSFGSQLSALVGQQAQNRITILEQEYAQRNAILEQQRQAELEAAGVVEQTEVEQMESDLLELQNNLERASTEKERQRIKEQIKIKQDAIKRQKINEAYDKKQEELEKEANARKKAIEREAAERQKQLAIFTTLVEIPTAAFQAYRSAQVLPFPASQIVGGILAAAATALGLKKLQVIQQTPLPMASGGLVTPPGITAQIGEGGNQELVAPLTQKIFNMMGQGIINAIAARQEALTPEEATIIQEPENTQEFRIIVNWDSQILYDGITRASRDGKINIDMRSLVKA